MKFVGYSNDRYWFLYNNNKLKSKLTTNLWKLKCLINNISRKKQYQQDIMGGNGSSS